VSHERTDAKLPIRFGDRVEPGDRSQIDDHLGLGQAELQERQQAVAASQQLCLVPPFVEDLEHGSKVARTLIVELARDHRCRPFLCARFIRSR
jgi:hypothetical protein